MMSLEQSPSRTWQWDSHQDPKHSRWLQSSLKELDEKVKAMLMLIEADADSFAQRAEMYYQKRPELLNMVEEFYRAHRYLAERYDHLTGEIKQNIPKALQVQYGLSCDSPRGSPFGRSAGRRDQQGFERLLKKFEAGRSDEQAQPADLEIVDISESDIKENGLSQEELSSSSSLSDSEVDSSMEVEKLQQAVQNLEEENKKLAHHCHTTIEENKALENRVNGLQLELLSSQEERLKLADTCEVGMKQAAALENTVRELGGELLRLREENAELAAETSRVEHLNEIEQELTALQQEKMALKEQIFKSNEERDQLQRKVDLLQGEGTRLRAIALEREDRNKNLEEVTSRLQEENQRLSMEISAATEHGKIAITALKFMKGELSSLVQSNKKLREEISEKPAKETLQAQQEEILRLEAENEKLKNDLQDSCVMEQKRVNELNLKIKELQRQLTFLGEENRKQKLVIYDRAEEKREAIRQLCFSMDVLKEKNQRLEEALSSAKSRLHVFRNTSSHRLPTWKRVLLGPWNGLPKSQPYTLAL